MIDLTPYTNSNGDIDLKKELIQKLAGIVESESHDYGNYVKFEDGTLIFYTIRTQSTLGMGQINFPTPYPFISVTTGFVAIATTSSWRMNYYQDGSATSSISFLVSELGSGNLHLTVHLLKQLYSLSGDGIKLYEVLQDHTSTELQPQEVNYWYVDIAHRIATDEDGNPTDEYPDWVQPTGYHDVYKKGDIVWHKEKLWICTEVDGAGNNSWEPGVYGWEITTRRYNHENTRYKH